MKALVREIIVHLMFVLLVQLVCKQSLDDNAFYLAENARKLMIHNGVTKSYFEGKNYEMRNKRVYVQKRDIIDASEVIMKKRKMKT